MTDEFDPFPLPDPLPYEPAPYAPPPFESEIAAAEPVPPPAHEPDAFERMVGVLRGASGYDPDGDDEETDELAAGRTRRWAGRVVLFATITLALLNVQSVRTWSETLPPGWGSETVRQLADVWDQRTALLGLDEPRKAIHDAYEGLKGKSATAP
jgi:hypothetical protein